MQCHKCVHSFFTFTPVIDFCMITFYRTQLWLFKHTVEMSFTNVLRVVLPDWQTLTCRLIQTHMVSPYIIRQISTRVLHSVPRVEYRAQSHDSHHICLHEKSFPTTRKDVLCEKLTNVSETVIALPLSGKAQTSACTQKGSMHVSLGSKHGNILESDGLEQLVLMICRKLFWWKPEEAPSVAVWEVWNKEKRRYTTWVWLLWKSLVPHITAGHSQLCVHRCVSFCKNMRECFYSLMPSSEPAQLCGCWEHKPTDQRLTLNFWTCSSKIISSKHRFQRFRGNKLLLHIN